MKEENQTIIRAINKFGRVPQTYELLNMIDDLQARIDKAIEDLGTLFGTDDEDINHIIRELKGEE